MGPTGRFAPLLFILKAFGIRGSVSSRVRPPHLSGSALQPLRALGPPEHN